MHLGLQGTNFFPELIVIGLITIFPKVDAHLRTGFIFLFLFYI